MLYAAKYISRHNECRLLSLEDVDVTNATATRWNILTGASEIWEIHVSFSTASSREDPDDDEWTCLRGTYRSKLDSLQTGWWVGRWSGLQPYRCREHHVDGRVRIWFYWGWITDLHNTPTSSSLFYYPPRSRAGIVIYTMAFQDKWVLRQ